MKRTYAWAVITTFLLLVHSASTASAQEYDIRLSREFKVSDKYRLTTGGRHIDKVVVLVGDTPVNENRDEFLTDLTAIVTVLETTDRGEMKKFLLAIENSVLTASNVPKPLLSPGAVVTGEAEGTRTIFKINGTPVDAITAKALEMIIPASVDGVNDDDIFGTREKKRIGEIWEINPEVAVKFFKDKLNVSTHQGDIKGIMTLNGIVKGGGEDFLVISGWIEMSNFSIPLPDGVTIQTGEMKGVFSGRFPINQARQSLSKSIKMTMWFVGNRAPDAKTPALNLQGAIERTLGQEIAPLN